MLVYTEPGCILVRGPNGALTQRDPLRLAKILNQQAGDS
jgi:hypothetical protein